VDSADVKLQLVLVLKLLVADGALRSVAATSDPGLLQLDGVDGQRGVAKVDPVFLEWGRKEISEDAIPLEGVKIVTLPRMLRQIERAIKIA